MFCRNCGNEILDENAPTCPKCGFRIREQEGRSGRVVTAQVFIILSAILGIFLLFIPTIVGIIAYIKLDHAKSRSEITGVAICTLLLCNSLAGMIMLTMIDEDLN